MAKIYQNGIVGPDKVSLIGVAQILGTKADTGSICTSPRINMWAKYKPFKSDVIGFTSAEATAAAAKVQRWGLYLDKGSGSSSTDGAYSSFSRMAQDAINGNLPTWKYDRPGASNRARPVDFANYDHNAKPPIRVSSYTSDKIQLDSATNKFYFDATFDITSEFAHINPLWLKLGDLVASGQSQDFSNMYFGVLMYDPSNPSAFYAATSSKKHSEEVGFDDFIGVRISDILNSQKTWGFVPFFATQPISDSPASYNGSVFPLSFATFSKELKPYIAAEVVPSVSSGNSFAIVFTENSSYKNNLYLSVMLNNPRTSAVTGDLVVTVNSSANANVQILKQSVTVPAEQNWQLGEYNTANGATWKAIDLTKVTGLTSGALIDAIKATTNRATVTISWAGSTITKEIINGGAGSPNDV